MKVEGMQDYRPIGAFSFIGRYRTIDFPISNMSNSNIDRIHVYMGNSPRSLAEHLGSGRTYNINSKRGKLQMLFPSDKSVNDIYRTDISAFVENIEIIERMREEYVVIAPSYMVYVEDFGKLLDQHIESGADITLLYHAVNKANESFVNCDTLTLNRQGGVDCIDRNLGNASDKNIFMDTYIMKNEIFLKLITAAQKESSMFTLADITDVASKQKILDIRGIPHKGYFAALTDFKSYYDANVDLIDYKAAADLFRPDWTIYTRTTDSCPTKYFEGASVKHSMISNGCLVEGDVENSVIGRGVHIGKGAVVKDCVVLSYAEIGENVHVEGQVVDKWAKIVHEREIVADPATPGYIRRNDRL